MVLPHDFLATMAWDVSISGVLLAITAITLRYNLSTASFEESNRSSRLGLGACGFYLFFSGITISFTWPYELSGGVYNVLFGGISTLSGLVLLSSATVLLFNADLKPVTYFAAITGLYAVVDAYAILVYSLTSAPLLSALGYLSFAAPAFLSIPVAHLENKWWKRLFIIFLILFSIAWLFQAVSFTIAHLNPS